MSNISPRLGLPYLLPAQAQKHVTHNMALQMLDILTQLSLTSLEAQTPPASPAIGEIHALGAAPEGAWAGRAGQLAFWDGESWQFVTPGDGWRATGAASGRILIHKDGTWQDVLADLDNLAGVGIATTADDQNRLAVAAPASLFSHAGAGHQMKLNKAGPGETASLLFQSGWSGHAELGLVGDLALALKLSPDGQSWQEVLRADPAAATLSLGPAGQSRLRLHDDRLELDVPLTGPAVQAGPLDTTAGKLVATEGARAATSSAHGGYYSPSAGIDIDTVDAGFVGLVHDGNSGTWPITPSGKFVWIDTQAIYSGDAVVQRASYGYASASTPTPVRTYYRMRSNDGSAWSAWALSYEQGNILGAVSQSGGTPTGALIERGSNANGEYVRYADGTQICTHTLNLTGGGGATITGAWVFPATFAATPHITVMARVAPAAGTRERAYWAGTGTSSINVNASMNVNWPASTSESHTVEAIGRWF